MENILLVVDMQNDFVSGALGSAQAQAIAPAVAAAIQAHKGPVAATLDTHDARYAHTQEGRRLPVAHCVKGTWGWELEEGVGHALSQHGYLAVEKDTFGAKTLPDALDRAHPGLHMNPERMEITLVGLCTDICVISNALLLKAFFPEVTIRVDGALCAGVTPESHQTALSAMRACQIEII